jgi:protein-tyrosine phosphatase
MAERLLVLALRKAVGDSSRELFLSHGAGTGSWHVGEAMNPPAARQVVARGGEAAGFRARRLDTEMIESADLILCATSEQSHYVVGRRPDAAGRTFVLGEFGRLLRGVDLSALPPAAADPYARGVALVELADAARGGQPPRPEDDLDDPWGSPDREFARVADEIEATVIPLATILAGDALTTS